MSYPFTYANGQHRTSEDTSYVRISHQAIKSYLDDETKKFDGLEYSLSSKTLRKILKLVPNDKIIKMGSYDTSDNSAVVLKDDYEKLDTRWANLRITDFLGNTMADAKRKLKKLQDEENDDEEEVKKPTALGFETCDIEDATHFKLDGSYMDEYMYHSVAINNSAIGRSDIGRFDDLLFKITSLSPSDESIKGVDSATGSSTNWVRKLQLVPFKEIDMPTGKLSKLLLADHPIKVGDTVKRISGFSANFPKDFEADVTSVHVVDGVINYSFNENYSGKKVKNSVAKFWEKVTNAHQFGNAQQEPSVTTVFPKPKKEEEVKLPQSDVVAPIAAVVASVEATKPTKPTQEPSMKSNKNTAALDGVKSGVISGFKNAGAMRLGKQLNKTAVGAACTFIPDSVKEGVKNSKPATKILPMALFKPMFEETAKNNEFAQLGAALIAKFAQERFASENVKYQFVADSMVQSGTYEATEMLEEIWLEVEAKIKEAVGSQDLESLMKDSGYVQDEEVETESKEKTDDA